MTAGRARRRRVDRCRSACRIGSAKLDQFFRGWDVPEGWLMLLKVQCPNPDCRASFSVSDAELGQPGRCRKCGRAFSLFSTRGSDAPSAGDANPARTPPRPPQLAEGETFGR